VTERLAVVTGAARGIGAAVAGRLARDGWSLLLVDACAPQSAADYPMPGPEDLAAVARDCAAAGAKSVDQLIADVGDGSVRGRLQDVLAGRVSSAVVTAAGMIRGDAAWAIPDDAFELTLRVNLFGVRHLADVCVPPMIEAGAGRFVAVSSAAALRATRGDRRRRVTAGWRGCRRGRRHTRAWRPGCRGPGTWPRQARRRTRGAGSWSPA
jgi:NAD(P)-dependent dehydrogenase (short-subunit alcohol dehydrogenase family)